MPLIEFLSVVPSMRFLSTLQEPPHLIPSSRHDSVSEFGMDPGWPSKPRLVSLYNTDISNFLERPTSNPPAARKDNKEEREANLQLLCHDKDMLECLTGVIRAADTSYL